MKNNTYQEESKNRISEDVKSQDEWHHHTGTSDLYVALKRQDIWFSLGWHDIKQRYRRSILGPFWFTISTMIMVGVLGFLYSTLLNQKIVDYLPYLGVGLIIWQFISTCVNEGCSGFIASAYIIKQIRMPLSVHVCRIACRNFIILLHSLPVVIILMFFFGTFPKVEFLLLFPGLAILFLNSVWICLVLSILCARYRDILPIVGNILQVAFFFTPIMWQKNLLKGREWAADFNPFYHLIEIIRAPILGHPINIESWASSLILLVIGFAISQLLLVRYRERIPYWL